MTKRTRFLGTALAAVVALTAAGCDDFLEVTNPGVVEAHTIDPEADAPMFAGSAFQTFAAAYDNYIVYSAWYTNEARVGDTFPTRNQYGRRVVNDVNGTHNSEVWTPLARSIASSEEALDILGSDGAPREVARAALTAGFAVQLMAESFCVGTIRVGPALSTAQMLDHSIERFKQAHAAAEAAGDDAFANAALVGLARAYLQAGNTTEAYATATEVDDDFEYNLRYIDDAGNRDRLGNTVWSFSFSRVSLVVGPEWIDIADGGDERIKYVDTGRMAQDEEHEFIRQDKYSSWDAPIRLASGLEARYIAAEASGDDQEMLDLINDRRTENGLATFSSTDSDAILAELMEQKARDFWLEGKRLGDWRRNPDAVPYILPSGSPYYKDQGNIGDGTCWPLPYQEYINNPNISGNPNP